MNLTDALASDVPAAVVYPVSHAAGMSVIRALQGRGIPIVAVDHDPHAAGLRSRYVTPHVTSGLMGLPFIAGKFKVKPVLFLVDDEDVFTSLSGDMGPWDWPVHFRIPSSGWDVVEPMVDKAVLYARAACAGFAIPEFGPLRPHRYPCIIKPTHSTEFRKRFGVKAFGPFTSKERLDQATMHLSIEGIPYVIQEHIEGPVNQLYTFAAYSGEGGEVRASFTGRKLHQWPKDFGTARLAESVYAPDVEEMGTALLKHWGYRGISLTEFKRDQNGQLRLIEVNVRPGGWPERLAQVCGANLVLAAYEDATKPEGWPSVTTTNPYGDPGKTKYGKRWGNLMEDVSLGLRGHWMPRTATDAFFQWRDPLPFLTRLWGWIRRS